MVLLPLGWLSNLRIFRLDNQVPVLTVSCHLASVYYLRKPGVDNSQGLMLAMNTSGRPPIKQTRRWRGSPPLQFTGNSGEKHCNLKLNHLMSLFLDIFSSHVNTYEIFIFSHDLQNKSITTNKSTVAELETHSGLVSYLSTTWPVCETTQQWSHTANC